jgi:hypothetical protein
MSPPTASKCVPKSGLQWPQEWQTQHEKQEEDHRQSKVDHDLGDDVWDELEEVGRIHKEKKAEEVINYLESRLSQLTTVDPERDESTPSQEHDLFSKHHKEVVEKGAGKRE